VRRAKVLLVDKDPITGGFIRSRLEAQDYVVTISTDYGTTNDIAGKWDPDLVLLDASASDPESYAACREMREISDVPIIILSACDEDLDKALFFNLGVDDYVTKPFSLEVLIARMKAVLRRMQFVTGVKNSRKFITDSRNSVAVPVKVPELT
jgi:DNA-binding response OmpR family regulator